MTLEARRKAAWRRRLCVVATLIMAGLADHPFLNAAAPGWSEIRAADFALRLRGSDKQLQEIACDLQRVAGAVRGMNEKARPRATVSIVGAENERGVRELMPQFWEHRGARPVGGYWSGPFGHHIVIRVDLPRRERLRRMLHEYAHFATHGMTDEVPPWLDEGISELWTNAVVDGEFLEIGRPVPPSLKLLDAGNWIPVRELVKAAALPSSSDAKAVARFYAESWALAHYLVLERRSGRLAFDRIPGNAELPSDAELRQYIGRTSLPTIRIPFSVSSSCGALNVRQLSSLESLIQQARAVVDGGRPASAAPLLEQASLMAHENPEVIETKGVVKFMTNEPSAAAALFDQAIAMGGASYISFYYRALLADAAPERTDATGKVPVADYLRRALQLDPEFTPARERLQALEKRP